MSDRPNIILGRKFLEALVEAGIISRDDRVRRVIIDAGVQDAVVMHVERYGDARLLQIVRTLDGTEGVYETQIAAADVGDAIFDQLKELTVQNRELERRLAAYEAKEHGSAEPS